MASRIVAGSLAVLVVVAAIMLTMSAGTTQAAPSPNEVQELLNNVKNGVDTGQKTIRDVVKPEIETDLDLTKCKKREFIDSILDIFTGQQPEKIGKCIVKYAVYPPWARALVIVGMVVLAIILLIVACCIRCFCC